MKAQWLTVLAVILGAGGCSPTFKINIGASPGKLVEHVVAEDPSPGRDKVAVIDVRGLLIDARRSGLLGVGANPVDGLVAGLEKARNDPAVRAVIVRITSPGGTVTASDMMYAELRRFRDETGRPVVASIGEVGASGGYYIALAADHIVVQPTSITGSVGVIFPTLNVSRGLSSIGVESRAITSGPNKDMANPLEPIREEQYAILREQVGELYSRFRSLVVARRPGLDPGDVELATDGRVMTGRHAVAIGLADEAGGVREAFAAAKRLAGVDRARMVKYVDEVVEEVTTPYASAPAGAGQVNLVQVNLGESGLAGRFGMQASGFYYLWMPEVP